MDLPLLMPMFDDRPTLLGMQGDLITLVLAAVFSVLGVLWVRRFTRVEEYHSFRATAGRPGSRLPLVTGVLAIGFLGFAVVAALNT